MPLPGTTPPVLTASVAGAVDQANATIRLNGETLPTIPSATAPWIEIAPVSADSELTPYTIHNVPAGTAVITVEKPGFTTVVATVVAQGGLTTSGVPAEIALGDPSALGRDGRRERPDGESGRPARPLLVRATMAPGSPRRRPGPFSVTAGGSIDARTAETACSRLRRPTVDSPAATLGPLARRLAERRPRRDPGRATVQAASPRLAFRHPIASSPSPRSPSTPAWSTWPSPPATSLERAGRPSAYLLESPAAGGAALSVTETLADASGVATSRLTVASVAGLHRVSVSTDFGGSLLFSVTGTSIGVASFRVEPPGDLIAGTARQVTVVAVDDADRPLAAVTETRTLRFAGFTASPTGDLPTVNGRPFGDDIPVAFAAGRAAVEILPVRARSTFLLVTDGVLGAGRQVPVAIRAGAL
jgi:hypothetical protein